MALDYNVVFNSQHTNISYIHHTYSLKGGCLFKPVSQELNVSRNNLTINSLLPTEENVKTKVF